MRIHFDSVIAALFLGAMLVSANAGAAELATGSTMQAFTLEDQREKKLEVNSKTQLVLFTREKDVSKMVFGVLGEKAPTFLQDRQAAFVMDISEMPRLITWAIAKPRMRRHAFSFMLDSSGEISKAFPAKTGSVTVLHLKDLKVEKVGFAANADELKKALDALTPQK